MNTSHTDHIHLSTAQKAFCKKMLNPLKFRLFTLVKVPAGFIAGMKLLALNSEVCQTSIPFKFLNKNPFKSIYFAVQSMAAELSTAALALLAIQGVKPSMAFIIVNLEAEFVKKATGKTYFTCENGKEIFEAVQTAINTGESTTVKAKTVGRMKDGTVVSTFYFTWSFKQRK